MNAMKTVIGRTAVVLFLAAAAGPVLAQYEVKVYEKGIDFPTYPIHEPDPNPMFFKGESYQGASKVIYPYPLIDNLSNDRTDKEWLGVFLENEYIKACVTPEIGGKLYWAEDKSNGYNFFYKNNVVKPANIGMLGAWVSGGIEWNVLHHHRASTYMPLPYKMTENADGSKTVWVGETEPRQRMRWIIGLTAFPGKSYLEAEVKIFNRTPHTHSFLYWANVSTHANKDYQVYFPPNADFGVDHSKVSFTHWPVSHEKYRGVDHYASGVDVSRWINHPRPVSIFCHELSDDFMGGYDHGQEVGTVHVANHQVVRGAKLFEWGPSELGKMWDKVLTEKDGPYIEIMVGAWSDNQPDYSWIRPYEVKTHKQYWYPIKDIGGILNANLNGAVNLEVRDGEAFFGFSVTQEFSEATVVMSIDGKPVFEKQVDVDPANAWTGTAEVPDGTSETDIRVALLNCVGEELVAYQPVKKEYQEKLPPVVRPPGDPADYQSVEELYLAGLRLLQFYNPVLDAEPYFLEALKRDPGNSDVHTIMGKQALMKGEFDKAAGHFRKAIARLSKDYTRPENCEAYYELGQVLKFQESLENAVDTIYRATWDYSFHSPGYHSLAEISTAKGNFLRALEQIDRSLSTNAPDLRARNLKAAIYRHLGNQESAMEVALSVLEEDPLNLRAAHEWFLASAASGNGKALLLEDLEAGMTGDHEDYLEIAVDYLNCGLYKDGIKVLERFKEQIAGGETDPMVWYYLGFLNERTGNLSEAAVFYDKAASLPTDYCFPFRLESLKVFDAALQSNPDDAKAYYYRGALLYDKQPEAAMKQWQKAVELDPELAIAHRNLGWGYYRAKDDIGKAIDHYEAALAVKKDDPMYYYELDKLYELNGTDPEVRLAMLEPNHGTVMKRNDSFLREIMVLNLNGKYADAVEYLSNHHFHIREGDMKIRDINVNAHLLLGMQYLEESESEKALEQFQLANTFPDNQQVGRTMNDHRIPQIYYYIARAYEAMGKRRSAKEHYRECAGQDIGNSPYAYYQGLACLQLKEEDRAAAIFNELVADGEKVLEQGVQKDVFAKFGESVSGEAVRSGAHLKIGLGFLGMEETGQARDHLSKAVELDASNLWATVVLENLENQLAGN